MLKLAVCDDNAEELNALKKLFMRYSEERGAKIDAEYYSERKQIIKLLPRAGEYDCIFLDVYMEELNGIDLARYIRKNKIGGNIIFFTTSRDHAVDAFGLNALHYLVKPVGYTEIEDAIERIMTAKKEQEACIRITNGSDTVRINLRDFIYSESQKHYQFIYLTSGTVEKARMSCAELAALLDGHAEFVRCGASFIINLKFIARITATEVYLLDGRRVPIPRRSYAELKQKHDDYFLDGGES